MKIGILAVQGAFAEHKAKLEKLGAQCIELRKKKTWMAALTDWCCRVGKHSTGKASS